VWFIVLSDFGENIDGLGSVVEGKVMAIHRHGSGTIHPVFFSMDGRKVVRNVREEFRNPLGDGKVGVVLRPTD
jgi:hypothetical protein